MEIEKPQQQVQVDFWVHPKVAHSMGRWGNAEGIGTFYCVDSCFSSEGNAKGWVYLDLSIVTDFSGLVNIRGLWDSSCS